MFKKKNPPKPGKRGKATFSSASRRRLLKTIAQIEGGKPIFVTLTYHKEWGTPLEWKADLNRFLVELHRKYPKMGGVWRLELQKRGAPHYHLLLWGGYLDKAWLSDAWHRATRSKANLLMGTRVEAIRSERGVMSYASKYMSKSSRDDCPEGIGRHWGIFAKNNLCMEPKIKVPLTKSQAIKVSLLMTKNIRERYPKLPDEALVRSMFQTPTETSMLVLEACGDSLTRNQVRALGLSNDLIEEGRRRASLRQSACASC